MPQITSDKGAGKIDNPPAEVSKDPVETPKKKKGLFSFLKGIKKTKPVPEV